MTNLDLQNDLIGYYLTSQLVTFNMIYFLIIIFTSINLTSAEEIIEKITIINKEKILVDYLKNHEEFRKKKATNNKTSFKKFLEDDKFLEMKELEERKKHGVFSEIQDFSKSKFLRFNPTQGEKYPNPSAEYITKSEGDLEIKKFLETEKN